MIHRRIIDKISDIHRFSGNFLFKQESLPDHEVEMALLCINFSYLAPESDKKEMCYRCLVHDLEESITSDIPRPIKHRSQELKDLIDKTAYEMFSEYASQELTEEVVHAKDFDNINGFLVHIADRVQCFMKMAREVEHFGNQSLRVDFLEFKTDNLPELTEEIKSYAGLSDQSKNQLIAYIKEIFRG